MSPEDEGGTREPDDLIEEGEDLIGPLEDEEPEAPPPATWAARQASEGAAEEQGPPPEDRQDSPSAEDTPSAEEEPTIDEEPVVGKEPITEDEPAAVKEPTAEDGPIVDEPIAEEMPSLPEGSSAEKEALEAEASAEETTPEAESEIDQHTMEYDVLAEESAAATVEEGPEEGEEEPEPAIEPQHEPEPVAEVEPSPPVPPVPGAVLTPAEGGVPPGMLISPGSELDLTDDSKPPKAGLWPRFLAASMVIVLSMAAATSISLILYATDIAKGLGGLPGLQSKLSTVDGGGPQTILILGSDIRPAIEDKGRSDTTMLLRLDPNRELIALLSIPRDLKVNIPGYGIGRLNEAYTIGGPKLTLQTVKDVTGLRIHHLVNVDFSGFAKAVDAIGCVYVDVDRDYYHSNVGLAAEAQYAEIDVDAGYQRLCGQTALEYVRYRHEDNDIVRAARQQDFLREARAKVPPGKLWSDRNDLIKIFTDYTTSDIDDAGPLIEVLKLFVELRDADVQKIEFEADIGGPDSTYVTSSDSQVRAAVRKFLGEGPTAALPSRGGGKGKRGGQKGGKGDGGEAEAKPALIDASSAAASYGTQLGPEVHFPLYAPTRLVPGSTYNDDSHAYGVDISKKEGYGAYKLVVSRGGPYGVPEYYGVMGTRWLDPPILESPSEVREIGGEEYLLFYDGDRLRLVGWKTDQASYWVNNTLTHTLDEGQMLAIARSMREF